MENTTFPLKTAHLHRHMENPGTSSLFPFITVKRRHTSTRTNKACYATETGQRQHTVHVGMEREREKQKESERGEKVKNNEQLHGGHGVFEDHPLELKGGRGGGRYHICAHALTMTCFFI